MNSIPLAAKLGDAVPIAIPCNPAPDPSLTRLFYSPKETEVLLGISHATCYRLINAGKLDARKLGNKTAITGESILRLAADLPKVASAP